MVTNCSDRFRDESPHATISSRAQFVADNLDSPLNLALTLVSLPPLSIPASRDQNAPLYRRLFRFAATAHRVRKTPLQTNGKNSRNRLVVIEGAKS